MVITVTLNPAVDKTMYIGNFQKGGINRISKSRYDIAGKGVNVSKVLKNLGITSVCTGFMGGVWEKYFTERLNAMNIATDFVKINSNIRVNIKIVDSITREHTDINEVGPEIDKKSIEQLISMFYRICSKGDIVILSGSASPSVPFDIYRTLIKIAKDKGAITILDSDGNLLREGIKEKPDYIKPNIDELNRLMEKDHDTIESIVEASKKIKEQGVKNVFISLGDKGAILNSTSGIYYSKAISVPVMSTVGAGDAMVAALVYGILNNYDDIEILKMAIACSTACVSLRGTEACTYDQAMKYIEKVDYDILEEF